jgi:threonine dehydratase
VNARVVAPPSPAHLDAAAAVVEARLAPTPLLPAPALGPDAHLKLESLQPTGSFKVRGALAALADAGAGAHVVTASAGNHALGIAWAAAALSAEATVVVPETASPAKLAALDRLPVRVVRHGGGYDEAEAHALELARAGARYVSPYNDTQVVAGQATLGRELDAQLPPGRPVTVVCALGGGGLASGIGLWAAGRPGAVVAGVEAERSPAFSTGLAAGRIAPIDPGETLADGLGGNIEAGSVTFQLVREHVASVCTVSEGEIEDAMRFLARDHGVVAEGAGAVAAAGVRVGRVTAPGDGALVVVVSGRNVALSVLARVLSGGL